ncbi:MAG TPA: hypothetical protein VGQ42_03550 [Candidatus Dormibacteraeota bacterium]|nr:hypothetical protein [Candidatus Dormibacteraeota bacterium]
MSERQRTGQEAGKALGERGPVTGTAPRHARHGGVRRDRQGTPPGQASRRDAVLRVLLEAYRRDLGPGAVDPL